MDCSSRVWSVDYGLDDGWCESENESANPKRIVPCPVVLRTRITRTKQTKNKTRIFRRLPWPTNSASRLKREEWIVYKVNLAMLLCHRHVGVNNVMAVMVG